MTRAKTPAGPERDAPPEATRPTAYDRRHLVIYLRLLDADAAGAPWEEVAHIVLGLDPAAEPERARRVWAAHLARARWMTEAGYGQLLQAERQ
jgi:hypothetical protein